jgi:hypothetical protein
MTIAKSAPDKAAIKAFRFGILSVLPIKREFFTGGAAPLSSSRKESRK